MARNNPNFSKSLKNIRRTASNGDHRSKKRFEEYVEAGSRLIADNFYTAASSAETISFLVDLIDNGLTDKAKHIINFMMDIYPKQLAQNPKLGKLISKFIGNGEKGYSEAIIDRFIFGKMPVGPSAKPNAEELASNESLDQIVKAFIKAGDPKKAALMIHRLAIFAPEELAKNESTQKCLEILSGTSYEDTVETITKLIAPHFPSTPTRPKPSRSRIR